MTHITIKPKQVQLRPKQPPVIAIDIQAAHITCPTKPFSSIA